MAPVAPENPGKRACTPKGDDASGGKYTVAKRLCAIACCGLRVVADGEHIASFLRAQEQKVGAQLNLGEAQWVTAEVLGTLAHMADVFLFGRQPLLTSSFAGIIALTVARSEESMSA